MANYAAMKTRPLIVGLCVALSVAAVGCASARRSEPVLGHSPASSFEFAAGRQRFMQHCHSCHPGGAAGLGPALNNKPLPGALIKFQVRHGLGAMPALKEHHVSNGDLDEIVRYLVALRRGK